MSLEISWILFLPDIWKDGHISQKEKAHSEMLSLNLFSSCVPMMEKFATNKASICETILKCWNKIEWWLSEPVFCNVACKCLINNKQDKSELLRANTPISVEKYCPTKAQVYNILIMYVLLKFLFSLRIYVCIPNR